MGQRGREVHELEYLRVGLSARAHRMLKGGLAIRFLIYFCCAQRTCPSFLAAGRPLITIGVPYTNTMPCNNKFRELADIMADEIEKLGGTVVVHAARPLLIVYDRLR